MIMTQNGPEAVVDTLYMKRVNCVMSSPYRVGNAMVSARHLVFQGGKLFYAGDIGQRQTMPGKHVEYYHMKVEGGMESLLSVDGQWCEAWDGYGYDVPNKVKGYVVMKNEKKECTRYFVREVKYEV
jgi:hypothetical protein